MLSKALAQIPSPRVVELGLAEVKPEGFRSSEMAIIGLTGRQGHRFGTDVIDDRLDWIHRRFEFQVDPQDPREQDRCGLLKMSNGSLDSQSSSICSFRRARRWESKRVKSSSRFLICSRESNVEVLLVIMPIGRRSLVFRWLLIFAGGPSLLGGPSLFGSGD
ncbi:hypothetical protein PGT21_021537 [Puccinia graminis f. sp. tritici]|uniref:Uncharacterized protein n=1 Tax=Puccinia graminis f. sp. tritici TaxID=56615 RepID=A0A5B0QTN9_PUCGR|nr:hypothetical protein PGT21_021537 [Puccinia graminis f. sp. tritici]